MTSGIAAVMTLPCSGLPEKSLDRRAALYSPLSFLLIPETAAPVKGENAVLRKNPIDGCRFPLRPSREKVNRENPQIFPIGKL